MLTTPSYTFYSDWDGVNEYEQKRATKIAQDLGYIGFAADIHGSEYEGGVPDDMRFPLLDMYRNKEPELFMSRIAAAVAKVSTMPAVDTDKIAVIGYCFGKL